MGGLRFKLEEDGDFLNNHKQMAAPPWTSIRELEYASSQLEIPCLTYWREHTMNQVLLQLFELT